MKVWVMDLFLLQGMINDVVLGLPIGISSLSYLSICGVCSLSKKYNIKTKFIKRLDIFFIYNFFYKIFNTSLLVLFFSIELDYNDFNR